MTEEKKCTCKHPRWMAGNGDKTMCFDCSGVVEMKEEAEKFVREKHIMFEGWWQDFLRNKRRPSGPRSKALKALAELGYWGGWRAASEHYEPILRRMEDFIDNPTLEVILTDPEVEQFLKEKGLVS